MNKKTPENMEQDLDRQVVVNPLEAAEMSIEQNCNMLDGVINNLPTPKADLTDGQTLEEIKELAPETLVQEESEMKTQSQPLRRKFENVDIIAALSAVVEKNTQHYQTDFEYDKESFMKSAKNPTPENKHFLWLSRQNGTECFRESKVYSKESLENNAWTYYVGSEHPVIAFAVEVNALANNKVVGNLYELDYYWQVEHIKRHSQEPEAVMITFTDETEKLFTHEQYKYNYGLIRQQYGAIAERHFVLPDAPALQTAIEQNRKERNKQPARSFSVYIKKLDKQQKSSVVEKLNQAKQQVKYVADGKISPKKSEPER